MKRLIVFRPASLLSRLQRRATAEGRDVSALLCRIAALYLRRHRETRR